MEEFKQEILQLKITCYQNSLLEFCIPLFILPLLVPTQWKSFEL